jgi:hypothetical protein
MFWELVQMKTTRFVQPRNRFGNLQAHLEMQSFLKALASYPAQFADEPEVSFEEHLNRLVVNRADTWAGAVSARPRERS